MEVVGRHGDLKFAEIAEEPLVGLDVLVASGTPELHAQRAVRGVHARVDPDSVPPKPLLGRLQVIERRIVVAEFKPRPAQSDLFQKEQVGVGNALCVDAVAELGVSRIVLGDCPPRAPMLLLAAPSPEGRDGLVLDAACALSSHVPDALASSRRSTERTIHSDAAKQENRTWHRVPASQLFVKGLCAKLRNS